ncbi:hypothetical protein [Ammoniphilus resinae]|nr:hypothetical protein [Ammoniphilus resinae]
MNTNNLKKLIEDFTTQFVLEITNSIGANQVNLSPQVQDVLIDKNEKDWKEFLNAVKDRYGVYAAVNTVNHKAYVGKGCIYSRASTHRSLLRYGKHQNTQWQNDWTQFGEDKFIWIPLFFARYKGDSTMDIVENLFIDIMRLTDERYGYNQNQQPKKHRLGDFVLRITPSN